MAHAATRSVRMAETAALLLLAMWTAAVWSFPSGAPLSACGHLMPIHEDSVAQTGAAPYLIVMSQTNYTSGEAITVTVLSNNAQSPFLAFMLQGRTRENKPVGHFSKPPQVAKLLSCYTDNDTLSHAAAYGRQAMEVVWHPPKEDVGDVLITGSIAKTKYVFWAVESQPIHGKTAYAAPPYSGSGSPMKNSEAGIQSSPTAIIMASSAFVLFRRILM